MDFLGQQQWVIIAVAFFGIIAYIAWVRWQDRKWIDARFGSHKTLAMTERYAHLLPDHKRAAIEQMVAGLKQKDITSIKNEESAG